MQLFRKYFYGDYDAIQKGGSTSPLSAGEGSGVRSAPPSPREGGREDGSAAAGRAEWPLWEIFIRSKQGLDHKHVGSLHAADAAMAIENARDVYTRRQEGVSIWVVESSHIHASNPDDAESFYEPANDKVYRHPTFYDLPDELTHM
ncbi:MAG: 1,2-phenylacetyl-CoA epoxidase subunit B [Chitinophagaceae bacterium]|nr:MAG: 1,2-phenylacetyl-CoA epoxidase subunit B [Chitinophagaceae bacterium]